VIALSAQAVELKKKAEDEAEVANQLKEVRAKQTKEIEGLQLQLDELQAAYDKLEKSKKKLQAEVEDLTIDVEAQRAKVLELEKKQRNFDKVLAEEKVRKYWILIDSSTQFQHKIIGYGMVNYFCVQDIYYMQVTNTRKSKEN